MLCMSVTVCLQCYVFITCINGSGFGLVPGPPVFIMPTVFQNGRARPSMKFQAMAGLKGWYSKSYNYRHGPMCIYLLHRDMGPCALIYYRSSTIICSEQSGPVPQLQHKQGKCSNPLPKVDLKQAEQQAQKPASQPCRVEAYLAMVIEYPSTCTVEIPLSATAFYKLSQEPPFCSFLAEVYPTLLIIHHCCSAATLKELVPHMHAQSAIDELARYVHAGIQPRRAAYGRHVVRSERQVYVSEAQLAARL